ncbi:MAG: hypothetical protein ACQEQK_03740, partial [Thermodesulfobacteriota bacterium]
FYRYKHKKESMHEEKFSGLPDPHPFDRDDLYEVIPMLTSVMSAIECNDGLILEKVEEIMLFQMPPFIDTREEVYTFLLSTIKQRMSI